MSPRALVCFALALLGILILAAWLWALSGRLPGSRFWLNRYVEDWQTERFVILGAPLGGFGLLCVAAIAAPVGTPVLAVLGVAGLVVLSPVLVYFVLAPIPIARFLFPRWARDVRDARQALLDSLAPPR